MNPVLKDEQERETIFLIKKTSKNRERKIINNIKKTL